MTDVATIDAGRETDRMVAEACGFTILPRFEMRCIIAHPDNGREYRFQPSTDWQDAMLAAERFGLFDASKAWEHDDLAIYALSRDERWMVIEVCSNDGPNFFLNPLASAETGPLAICRAILALLSAVPPTQVSK